uniref:Zf-RVT domain-containing protein n=1 Tax=Steinernema glaseri TaxID=37863 RepID=A0A1I8AUB3_9BILA
MSSIVEISGGICLRCAILDETLSAIHFVQLVHLFSTLSLYEDQKGRIKQIAWQRSSRNSVYNYGISSSKLHQLSFTIRTSNNCADLSVCQSLQPHFYGLSTLRPEHPPHLSLFTKDNIQCPPLIQLSLAVITGRRLLLVTSLLSNVMCPNDEFPSDRRHPNWKTYSWKDVPRACTYCRIDLLRPGSGA